LASWNSAAPYQRLATPARTSAPLDITLKTPDKANAMFLAGKVVPLSDQSADYPALVLANYMLGGGFLSSRLATRIRQKDGLSYGVGTQFSASSIDSSAEFFTYAIYAPENRAKVEQAFNEEMIRAAKSGFTTDEIAKAKAGWLENRKEGLAENGAIAGALQRNLFTGRSMAASAALEARVNALTPEQLQAVVVRYLDPATMALVKAGDFDKKAATPTIRP
jgi:zinc protease